MTKIEIEKRHRTAINDLILYLKNLKFLTDEKVEFALQNIPRHEFVPESELEHAYDNEPLPIMKNQTISQPGVVTRMTEWLDVKNGQNILEIGTGSGWQSAILSYLVGSGTIYSVERHPELAKFARENLKKLKIDNVHVILGDGSLGYAQASPYDRIIITAACIEIPLPLLDQLSENGLIIAPVGGSSQSLVLLRKTSNGMVEIKNQPKYVFVPLVGKFGKK
ncbi:MAG: protein-L-isoaspartate(D-aspartate) O-methyltransferase [Nitrosopumilus sp.]|nr:protein-L-isoaspartate(D-aspartate) O-methyltransferase [Nitrosopumilus sp.]MDF2426080.1 protein-L-isoaspartate(D-aspartate) O-methyltransferase [Nitrosopumilus sp.]MDF2426544.1 protein-L-isoaspartate(D-aspartate) O-methyltransferase [Nitrosopumilus sp.]MDF2430201.1 protein-L-isoaspartate(D-aspartate) O-methyltransferase [Nitrosopumilus sp.]